MITKHEAEQIVRRKLEQISDELNNHVDREAYAEILKATAKAAGEILKAAKI